MELLEALKADNYSTIQSSAFTALPDPELFFTWYCERARDIERGSGSCEAAIELLDAALARLSGRSLAKRFITATRNSLLRYRGHLAALASKLNSKEIASEEKARLLENIRSADWSDFEQQRTRPPIKPEPTEAVEDVKQNYSSNCAAVEFVQDSGIDWSVEEGVLDSILRGNLTEAINFASQSIPFPVLPEGEQARVWLAGYCQVLQEELTRKPEESCNLRTVPSSLCNDPWSSLVEGQVGCSLTLAGEDEQIISLLAVKSEMALKLLQKNK